MVVTGTTQLLLLIIAAVVTTTQCVGSHNGYNDDYGQHGCTSKFLLPDRPYLVMWNHPSVGCEAHGIDLNLSAWDIVENKKDAFAGANMIIYYGLGKWPKINLKTRATFNGGVPQQGNLSYHLSTARDQVLKSTKAGFDGVSVIDMENWRPMYQHNFDSLKPYQLLSIDIVKKEYPYLNKSAIEREAVKQFDAGARLFMEGTLNLTHSLRPGGHWGYYGFPRAWSGASGQKANDQLAYLWRGSRGLFPRIYMSDRQPPKRAGGAIKAQIRETLRVWAKYSSPHTLILPYSLCQNSGSNFFSKENLTLAIGLPAEMGAAGVVLWGASSYYHTHDECVLLKDYVRTTLGPYVKNLTQFFSACSLSRCSAHGRCVRKDLESAVQQLRREAGQQHCLIGEELLAGGSSKGAEGCVGCAEEKAFVRRFEVKSPSSDPYQDYVCRCLAGWTGDRCEKEIR